MKKSILTMTAALAFSLCASAQTQYVMQIKKNNGDVVRMNADEVQGISFETTALSDRTALMDHVRSVAKGMAEQGGNFGARKVISMLCQELAEVIVNNAQFFKGIRDASVEAALKSAKDVEQGSELQQMGYAKYIEWGIDKLNGRFTFKSEGAPEVAVADQIEIIFPVTLEGEEPLNCKTTIKGTGNTVKMVFPVLSDRTTALVLLLPESIVIEAGRLNGETFAKDFDVILSCAFDSNAASSYVSFLKNRWSLTGVQHAFLKPTDKYPIHDENGITIGLGFDPVTTGQMTSSFSFDQNNVPVFDWKGSVTIPMLPTLITSIRAMIAAMQQSGSSSINVKDLISGLSGGGASGSIVDLLLPLLTGSTIDNMETWMMGDLGFKVKVTDIPKLQQLLMQMREARYQRKGEAAMNELVQQLNTVIEGTVSCKALSQELPFKMVTKKFGVNYIPSPAVKFADEQDYVPMSELTDKETAEYVVNAISGNVPQVVSNARTMVSIFTTLLQLLDFEEK